MGKITAKEFLGKETPEHKIERLENEVALLTHFRIADQQFTEKQYKEISLAYLEICDSGYCKGDLSVGDSPCQFYEDDRGECSLKRICGLD